MKTICLNMIVKDESAVILRCLASIKNLIDNWVIVDTGSTDGTQQIIQEFLQDIPGELHERPWVNFAHNRNEALDLTRHRADYILFIDADERLVFDTIDKNQLTQDFYVAQVQDIGSMYLRALLIRDHPGWKWSGIVHESIYHSEEMKGEVLKGVINESNFQDGHRARDPEKFLKDAEILKKAIKDDPADHRSIFYLGQCYACAHEWKLAIDAYEKRAALGGNADEEFWSLFMIGLLQQALGMPPDIFIPSLCKAYLFDPLHIEPLYKLSNYFFQMSEYYLGYLVAKLGLSIPLSNQWMRASLDVYDHELLLTFANCAYCMGNLTESCEAYHQLLSKPKLKPNERAIIEEILSSLSQPHY